MQYREFCGKNVSALGFGTMRMPVKEDGKELDYPAVERMFERAFELGVNYFDTAYFYHNFMSEKCVGQMLEGRDRNSYFLATKLPLHSINSAEDCKRIFDIQMNNLKTDRLDYFLAHCVNEGNYKRMVDYGAYEFLMDLKRQGVVDNVGFSFHDATGLYRRILDEYDWDFVQLQINYLDWDIQDAKTHVKLANEKNLPVIVMEPVRGGALANLSDDCLSVLKGVGEYDAPAWALRYAADVPGVKTVLSGMSNLTQLEENARTFSDLQPLTDAQISALKKVKDKIIAQKGVPCTECRYCEECPVNVAIPESFVAYNNYAVGKSKDRFHDFYRQVDKQRRPCKCIECGACESVCPQRIGIIEKLKLVTEVAVELGAEH